MHSDAQSQVSASGLGDEAVATGERDLGSLSKEGRSRRSGVLVETEGKVQTLLTFATESGVMTGSEIDSTSSGASVGGENALVSRRRAGASSASVSAACWQGAEARRRPRHRQHRARRLRPAASRLPPRQQHRPLHLCSRMATTAPSVRSLVGVAMSGSQQTLMFASGSVWV
jgi:hypothetical protein